MKIKLKWQDTKDEILFDVINQDIAKWFVEQSMALGNDYTQANMITDLPLRTDDTDTLISEINSAIDNVNAFLKKMKMPEFVKPANWYDQDQLNRLHKDWAETRYKWPKLPELLYQRDRQVFDDYQKTNCHIHLVEKSFVHCLRAESHWRLPNPFKNNFYQWQECHLFVVYPGHGREAFEKFQNLDDNVDDIEIDNCNWDNIDSFFKVSFRRPYKLTPPEEFLTWCANQNLIPHREHLALANLADWKNNLTKARELFAKNIKIKYNICSLEIVE
jgi:hypothetical protein